MANPGFLELVRRSQGGDRSAFETLMACVRPALLRAADRFMDSARASQSTSDLVQEAEVRAWQRLGEFAGGVRDEETEAKFRAWTLQILRRLNVDLQRSRNALKRRPPRHGPVAIGRGESTSGSGAVGGVDPPGDSPTPSAALWSKERSASIQRALERIPNATNREIVRLRFFDGLTLREVAGRVELPYETVKKRFQSTLRRLESLLAGLLDPE